MKKANLKDMTFGKPSGAHENMTDVVQGWDDRIKEVEQHNAEIKSKPKLTKAKKTTPLPSETDKNFTYGMSTHDLDVRADPFLHSNAVIAQRVAKQEAEEKRLAEKMKNSEVKPKRKIDPARPTAASIGHTKHAPAEPALKDTFKMKRFTQIEHGAIDTGLRKKTEK